MAGFGQVETPPTAICPSCMQPTTGTKVGTVGNHGFGSVPRQGLVPACENPQCSEGQKNLAAK
ncbi:MAG: hypothetical protein WCW26_03440 [Candidatus Buchananbacteria bacterium]